MEDGFYTDNMKWIYLTPIFQAASDHKYNTTDYQRIDEDFGTEDIFKELVDTAHDLGIRVMIDAVFNHSGREFFAWQDSIQWLQGDEYDSVMNYPFMKSINIFFQQLVILVTMPGTPCIYYGTEIAMDGKCGPYNRKPMPWEDIERGKYDALIAEVKSLIHIRKKYRALRSNQIQWKNTKGRYISYVRPGEVTMEVYLNAGEQHVTIDLQEREIVFAHGYSDQRLLMGGALIVRRNVK